MSASPTTPSTTDNRTDPAETRSTTSETEVDIAVEDREDVEPSQNGLKSYFQLKEPVATSSVPFHQVLIAPIDSAYADLLSDLAGPDETEATPQSGLVRELDYRPLHWYPRLRELRNKVHDAEQDSKWTQELLDKATKVVAAIVKKPSADGFEEAHFDLEIKRRDLEEKRRYEHAVRAARNSLLAEIHSAGYRVLNRNQTAVPKAIEQEGYDFQIVKFVPSTEAFQGIEIPKRAELAKDKVWKEAVGALGKAFSAKASLPPGVRRRFNQERTALDKPDPKTKDPKVERLRREIRTKTKSLDLKDAVVKNCNAAIQEWKADKELLEKTATKIAKASGAARWRSLNTWAKTLPCVETRKGGLVHLRSLARLRFFVRIGDGVKSAVGFPSEDGKPNWRAVPPEPMESFFGDANDRCTNQVTRLKWRIEAAKREKAQLKTQITKLEERVAEFEKHGLAIQRLRFLKKWNDPQTNGAVALKPVPQPPTRDRIVDFYRTLDERTTGSAATKPKVADTRVYHFDQTPRGYVDENGWELTQVLDHLSATGHQAGFILPGIDPSGRIERYRAVAVLNPAPSGRALRLPCARFVETYSIEVRWIGYGLGELSHSVNLFPGESKELVIEKSTRLSSKRTRTSGESTASSQKTSSSFEDKLSEEFALQTKTAVSQQQASAQSQQESSILKESASSSTESISESSSSLSASVKASASCGFASAEAEVNTNSKSSSKKTSRAEQSNSSENAMSVASSLESKSASSESRDATTKNVKNSIRKTASATSQENRLEISSASSEEREESTNEKEVIRLENPNVCRTVNYNFFQLQNQYETSLVLKDVKIVFDSGVELVAGTGITDIRAVELEEFTTLVELGNVDDPRWAALCAIVATNALRLYADGHGNLAAPLRADEGFDVPPEVNEILLGGENAGDAEDKADALRAALMTLSEVPFRFIERDVSEPEAVGVNCGAYHLESEVGWQPAAVEGGANTQNELPHALRKVSTGVSGSNDSGEREAAPFGDVA